MQAAVDHAVPLPVITAALYARFASRQEDSPAMKVVAALRNQFGGHAVTAKEGEVAKGAEHIGLGQHQLAVDHAALLAARQHLDGLAYLIAREQQPAERAAHDLVVVRLGAPLAHPGEQIDLLRELRLRVLRHVADLRVLDPGDAAAGR